MCATTVKHQKGASGLSKLQSKSKEFKKDSKPGYMDPRIAHHYPWGIKHGIVLQCFLLATRHMIRSNQDHHKQKKLTAAIFEDSSKALNNVSKINKGVHFTPQKWYMLQPIMDISIQHHG